MNKFRNSTLWRVLALSLLVGALSACHTMEGAGRDIEKAGDAIEDSAERNRDY